MKCSGNADSERRTQGILTLCSMRKQLGNKNRARGTDGERNRILFVTVSQMNEYGDIFHSFIKRQVFNSKQLVCDTFQWDDKCSREESWMAVARNDELWNEMAIFLPFSLTCHRSVNWRAEKGANEVFTPFAAFAFDRRFDTKSSTPLRSSIISQLAVGQSIHSPPSAGGLGSVGVAHRTPCTWAMSTSLEIGNFR